MRGRSPSLITLSASVALMLACDSGTPVSPSTGLDESSELAKSRNGLASSISLPKFKGGGHGEAYAIDGAGTVIAGYGLERSGAMRAATWTLNSGSWAITALAHDANATGAVGRAVNDEGDVAGNDWPGSTPHPVLWPATGGFAVLGCGDLGEAYGISAAAQITVGQRREPPWTAAVWQPGRCREDLPSLAEGGWARAHAANADGNIVGGAAAPDATSSSSVPVRWTRVSGGWQVEQLDSRPGSVRGANGAGDLVGSVQVACADPAGCSRAIVWPAAGGSHEIGTLGGAWSVGRDINAAGEVVGTSSLPNGTGAPFFWSESLGMTALSARDGGHAFALSDVRGDGTRLVVGAGGRPFGALLWAVRNP